MGTEREPQGSRSEFNRLTSLTSFIGERFLFPLSHQFSQLHQRVNEVKCSQGWQRTGRLATIILTGASVFLGAPSAKAEPLRDGGGQGGQGIEFKLGFKTLDEQIPNIAGEPLENEHYGPNGDSLQRTTTGLMVWRKADNWTAFTDGYRTWVNGPFGVMSRTNDERFNWESPEVVIVDRPGDPGFRKKIEDPLQYLKSLLPKLREHPDQITFGPIREAIEVMTKYGVTIRYQKELFPDEGASYKIVKGKQPFLAVKDGYVNRDYSKEIRAITLAHELNHISDREKNPQISHWETELNSYLQDFKLAQFLQVDQFYISYFESELEKEKELFNRYMGGK